MSGPVSTAAKANVLVVDDEDGIRAFLTDALTEAGHRVAQAPDGEAALTLLAASSFDVVLTDLKMPRVDGSALLRQIRQDYPETEVIVLTAHGSIASAVDAMRNGAFDYLQKPVSSPDRAAPHRRTRGRTPPAARVPGGACDVERAAAHLRRAGHGGGREVAAQRSPRRTRRCSFSVKVVRARRSRPVRFINGARARRVRSSP